MRREKTLHSQGAAEVPVRETEIGLRPKELEEPAVLALRIRDGDSRAEDQLVERYSPGLRVLLARLTREPAVAEDVHQETFAVALTKLRQGELRNPAALAAFLRSTARNLLIAHQRKEARYHPSELEPEGPRNALWRSGVEEGGSQLRQVLAGEKASMVRQLLGELRFERDRQILLRYYLTEAPKAEICEDLGVNPKLFNRALYRARERMRELWQRSEKRRRLEGRR